ncbi:MAG: flippase-like domain-containing protein [Bacteroidetes bacterium]|nr:flippase-like domain-containing protein [Bacteroidota bacterium]
MKSKKKILTVLAKIAIGIVSFWIIYNRMSEIPQLKEHCLAWLHEPKMYFVLALVLCLMPVNWGIESYKWKSITTQIESISYSTAIKSVFSGICVGNIAPGRAMEFLAKIIFFKFENRPSITVLHFINGMFQMLITVTVGIIAIGFKLNQNHDSSSFIYLVLTGGLCMILFFCWAIFNVSFIQQKLKFIKWFQKMGSTQNIQFSKTLILKLISLSIVRYLVFTTQFYLIYNALTPQNEIIQIFMSIAAYFMLTSLIPMISVIEPAIRAAIALFVFNNTGGDTITIVLASTFVWIINVVIPSAIGYVIILKEKIDFRSANVN